MGKFREALKKASKEDNNELSGHGEPVRPLEPPGVAHEKPSLPVPESVESKRDMLAPLDEAVASPKETPVVEASSASMPQQSDVVTPKRHQRQPGLSGDLRPSTTKRDSHTLVKVNASRPAKNRSATRTVPQATPLRQPAAPRKGSATPAASGRALRISYSQTKVQAIDPEKLKNNKIFSIFDDIETTDQIKILRTQVLERLKRIDGNSILVTSSNPYEGKTFTSINLGVSIAKEFSRTVLIIDADLRKPTKRHTAFSTEFFTLNVDVGLTDYLRGQAEVPDILINPGIDKLTLIPAGNPVDNAPELLNSDRMQEMMADVKSRYASDRLVILDGPAMLPFPDAAILSHYVDGVLPVVELEKTSVEQLKRMMKQLKGVNILGTVLNKNKG